MDARVTVLKTSTRHVEGTLDEIKQDLRNLHSDIRALIFAGFSGVAFLLIAMGAAYVLLTAKMEEVDAGLSRVEIGMEKIAAALFEQRKAMSMQVRAHLTVDPLHIAPTQFGGAAQARLNDKRAYQVRPFGRSLAPKLLSAGRQSLFVVAGGRCLSNKG